MGEWAEATESVEVLGTVTPRDLLGWVVSMGWSSESGDIESVEMQSGNRGSVLNPLPEHWSAVYFHVRNGE